MIFIGFLAGLIARALKPGNDKLGFIYTTLVGIFGSVLSGVVGRFMGFYEPGDAVGFLSAVFGAIVLLYLLQYFNKK